MYLSAAIAETKVRTHCGILSSATIMLRALDLASAGATHRDAVGPASRQAGSALEPASPTLTRGLTPL